MSSRIVVVGGGFAGFWAAVAARRVAPAEFDVVMVSREATLQMRPRLYETNPESLQIDLSPILQKIGIEFVPGELTRSITLRASSCSITRRSWNTDAWLSPRAARCVDLCSRARTRRTRSIRSRKRSPLTSGSPKSRVIAALRASQLLGLGSPALNSHWSCGTVLPTTTRQGPAEHARILLFDRADVVGPELGAGPRPVIEAALAEARVELRLGASVTALARDSVLLSDGQTISPMPSSSQPAWLRQSSLVTFRVSVTSWAAS